MPRWTNSLAARLLLSHFAVLLLVAALGVFGPMMLLRWNAKGLAAHALAEESQQLLSGLRLAPDGRPTSIEVSEESAWLYRSLPGEFFYCVVDAQGRVVLSSRPGASALSPAGKGFDADRSLFDIEAPDTTLRVLATPIPRAGQGWTLQVAASQRLVKLTRLGIGSNYVRSALVPLTILLLVVSGVIAWTLRRMLTPLREASLAAGRIAPDALKVRLEPSRVPTEVLPLINAFNLALDRLERGFAVQQEFLATAAHELKTPLALIRAQLEADGCPADSPLLADVDLMSRQVQQLLHLAEVSEAQNFNFEAVEMHAVATEVVAYLSRLAERAEVRLQIHRFDDAEGATTLRADHGTVFILMKNLVENAIQHSPAGGVVSIGVGAAELCIADQGPGIPTADLSQLFERFWRGRDRRHHGAGLGLTICQQIAQAHGWRLMAESRGQGAVFTLHTRAD